MDNIMVKIVIVVLSLGLLGYSVYGIVTSTQNISDTGDVEHEKILIMLEDPNTITGNQVRSQYYKYTRSTDTLDPVAVRINNLNERNVEVEEVRDKALYKISKDTNEHGKLYRVTFDQIDLSRQK